MPTIYFISKLFLEVLTNIRHIWGWSAIILATNLLSNKFEWSTMMISRTNIKCASMDAMVPSNFKHIQTSKLVAQSCQLQLSLIQVITNMFFYNLKVLNSKYFLNATIESTFCNSSFELNNCFPIGIINNFHKWQVITIRMSVDLI